MRETKGVLEKLEAQAAKDKQELQGTTPCTHHTTDGSTTYRADLCMGHGVVLVV